MSPLSNLPAAVLRRQLADLPGLIADAYSALAMRPGRGIPVGNPNGPGSRPPMDLTALSLVGGAQWNGHATEEGEEPSVDAVLSYWCQVHSGQPCSSVTAAVQYLLLVHDDMVERHDADEYAAQIRWHHRRLSRLGPPPEALPVGRRLRPV